MTVTLNNIAIRHGYAREHIRSGGAIENQGTLTVVRGINIGGIVHLTHCTITGNGVKGELRRNQVDAQPAGGVSVRGTLHYTNTLIANNPKGGACIPGPSAVIGANVYNLVEDGGYSPTFSGDLATEDLADNGGDTQTRSLTSGSPALDAIPAEACLLTTDQRGYARPMMHTSSGTPCYIGAFELGDESPAQGVMQGWAVSAEKDDYGDVGMSDMLVDYRSVALMRQVPEDAGWAADHIRGVREFDREMLNHAPRSSC